jgi:hypothetical protein
MVLLTIYSLDATRNIGPYTLPVSVLPELGYSRSCTLQDATDGWSVLVNLVNLVGDSTALVKGQLVLVKLSLPLQSKEAFGFAHLGEDSVNTDMQFIGVAPLVFQPIT